MNLRIVGSSSRGVGLGGGGDTSSVQAAHANAAATLNRYRSPDFLDSTVRPLHNAGAQSIFPIMAHNNGMVPGSTSPGVSEASAKFASKMTGAELAAFVPHRPVRPEKSEGGKKFSLVSEYEPAGDQPSAISELVGGTVGNERDQVLLGVTGSGKTFTMAKVIEAVQRPALILAPNKTLAAQLFSEMKLFFPENAVEYFVSYYDYYQPEAYIPRTDTYIEKDSSINEEIDRMRHSATRAIRERDDVIIVASVSCIYGIGSVETYSAMTFDVKPGDRIDEKKLMGDLVAIMS